MKFTADQVWGCAAAAQRINEGYFKEDQWDTAEAGVKIKTANKALVKGWLRDEDYSRSLLQTLLRGRLLVTISNHTHSWPSQADSMSSRPRPCSLQPRKSSRGVISTTLL